MKKLYFLLPVILWGLDYFAFKAAHEAPASTFIEGYYLLTATFIGFLSFGIFMWACIKNEEN